MRKKNYLAGIAIVSLVLVAIFSFPQILAAKEPLTLKIAHDSPEDTPWGIGAKKFKELLEKKSNGTIKVDVYPAAQLGDLRELMELLQAGTLDFAFQTSGVASSFIPEMGLFALPFLFNNKAQMEEVYTGPLGQKLLAAGEKAQIKGLSLNVHVFRSPMNNVRPLKTPADFKGLKMRLMQVPIMMETYKALGASPVALPFSELYMAAKTGAVDGFEGAIPYLYSQKLYEVAKYLSTLPVFANTCLDLASLKVWNEKLNAEQRKMVMEVIPEVDKIMNAAYDKSQEADLNKMKEYGVKVYEGPFNLKPYREAVKPVYAKHVPKLPKEAQEVVGELQKQWK